MPTRLAVAATDSACAREVSAQSGLLAQDAADHLPARNGVAGGHAEVVTEALARCGLRFAEVYAGAAPIVLHADLHGGNLKWHGGRLAVFDLDDAGFGVPALDLAISTFYLRAADPAVEAALRVQDAAGGAVLDSRVQVTPREVAPNGEGCSPLVWQAWVGVGPGGVLQEQQSPRGA